MALTTMKAVVYKGLKQVVVEDRPVPKIQDGKDVICKVRDAGLCGRYCSVWLLSNARYL